MLEKEYDFRKWEQKLQELWENEGTYRFDREGDGEIYSIDTPPPTVSGGLHIGHIFSYTQAEMIARFQRMQGRRVFYPFGFDDNGLPTERLVEKEEGIIARDLPRSEFIEKCLKTTAKYEEEFKRLWQSLGFSVDWSLLYRTVSPQAMKISQKSFLELASKGKAYLKEMPVLWCTGCRTSIAQAELDAAEKETDFNFIPFMVGEEAIPVATTRPELLYGCVALFVNPGDERYRAYIGREAEVPLYGHAIPVIADEGASMEKGTGAVMCATFGDAADLEWYNRHGLPYRKVVNPDGTVNEAVPCIGGLSLEKARAEIRRLLTERGLLLKSERLTHTAAVHERCGRPIEIIPSKQWYIDILSEKERYLEAAEEINWYPACMKERYRLWVQNLKWDWCISRQRYFGVPIPVWYCSACGEIRLPEASELPVNPMEKQPGGRCKCGCDSFLPETAVLDTWATSSLTPLINARWGEEDDAGAGFLPMSMRTQAHEIIRTWAFYTIVKSLYHTGKIPWKDIMICGFVMAKKGEKISKSKDNAKLSPAALIAAHSADAVRYWAANAKLGSDTMFSEEELKASRRFLIKLWNAARFSLMHLEDFGGGKPEVLLPQDAWILERLNGTAMNAAKQLNAYETGDARHEIDRFFWNDYCDNYLELVKERLYKPGIHGAAARESARYAVFECMLGILKLYAPYVPHITEAIYQSFYRPRMGIASLHSLKWNNLQNAGDGLREFGGCIGEVLAEARKFKAARSLSMKAPLEAITVSCPGYLTESLEQAAKDLKACTAANRIAITAGKTLEIRIVGCDSSGI